MQKKIITMAILATMVAGAFALLVTPARANPAAQIEFVQVPYAWDSNFGSILSGITNSDDSYQAVTLPFAVDFGDAMVFTTVYVSSNGMVCTQTWYCWYYWFQYDPFYRPPTTYYPATALPYGADLNPATGGDVYARVDSNQLVVTWSNVPHYYNTGAFTFQIAISNAAWPNNFRVNFNNMNYAGWDWYYYYGGSLVGVNRGDGTIGTAWYQFDYTGEFPDPARQPASAMSIQSQEKVTCPLGTDYLNDVESGTAGWTATVNYGSYNFQIDGHEASFAGHSPSNVWYFGNPSSLTYGPDGPARSASLTSSPIAVGGGNGVLKINTKYATEDTGTFWDSKAVQISKNFGPFVNVGFVSGFTYYGTWGSTSFPLASVNAGDSIRIRFVFNTVDGLFNNYHGWDIDDIEVLSEVCFTTHIVISDFVLACGTVLSGGATIAYVTATNVGPNEGIASFKTGLKVVGAADDWRRIDFGDGFAMDDADNNNRLDVGGSVTWALRLTSAEGTLPGVTSIDVELKYNADDGLPATGSAGLAVVPKMNGGTLAEYRHCQDASRHMAAAGLSGIAQPGDLTGALASYGTSTDAGYKAAKRDAANLNDGLGKYGLAPGQESGNEGNRF